MKTTLMLEWAMRIMMVSLATHTESHTLSSTKLCEMYSPTHGSEHVRMHTTKECLENLKRIDIVHIYTTGTTKTSSTVLRVTESIEVTPLVRIGQYFVCCSNLLELCTCLLFISWVFVWMMLNSESSIRFLDPDINDGLVS